MGEIWVLKGHRLGFSKNPWVRAESGLSQVWVKTEATVHSLKVGQRLQQPRMRQLQMTEEIRLPAIHRILMVVVTAGNPLIRALDQR
jgi:hypothetical protein